MRLHRLEIEGFGPFRRPQQIDFDAYRDDGLFLIAGRTGAGKSSILDAVCFALYGSIPRYDAGEKQLRSDHSEPGEPTRVALEFSNATARYRVERSPEYLRPAKRGDKLTRQAAEVRLFVSAGDEWDGLGARQKDVDGELLPEILQLTKDQFLQVILLAQNRFARFLLAKDDERRGVLRTLFGTKRFDDYALELEARRKSAESGLTTGRATLDARLSDAEAVITQRGLGPHAAGLVPGETDGDAAGGADAAEATPDAADVPPTPEQRLAAARAAVVRAEYRRDAAATQVDAAEDAYLAAAATLQAQTRDRDAQEARDDARSTLVVLDARAPEIDAIRAERAAAEQAEVARASLEALDRADERLRVARGAVDSACDAWQAEAAPDTHGAADTPPGAAQEPEPADLRADLRAFAEQLGRDLGAWADAADLEREADGRAQQLTSAQQAAAAAEAAVASADERLAALPALIDELARRIAEYAQPAGRADEWQAQVAAAGAGVTAAERADAAQEAAQQADAAHLAAATALDSAAFAYAAVLQRRLDGFAGELAMGLRDGQPCAVCGALEHPRPAPRHDEPASEADVERAAAAKDAAFAADRAAAEIARERRERVAALRAEAHGRQADDWRQALREAEQALAAARTAQQDRDLVTAARDRLVAERDALGADRRAAEERASAARGTLATARERVRAADERIRMARGTAASVAARIAAASRRRAAAIAFADALDDASACRDARRGAAADLDGAIAGAPIADADALRDALRSASIRADLAARIDGHDQLVREVKARLLPLELQVLPDERIDLAAFEATVSTTKQSWARAQAERATADAVLSQLMAGVHAAETVLQEMGAEAEAYAVVERLAHTVSGREPNRMRMSLETFVLAAELEEIVAAANVRLAEMSSGRYTLEHSDQRAARNAASGLGIRVFDAHTGRSRPPSSLSGGETFLASLALALGLAEVVTARAGGVRLDSLFIDEGFGSLDGETLDVAMRTLDELRAGGRTVGVISHVEAMQEQIPARLEVRVDADGSSSVVPASG